MPKPTDEFPAAMAQPPRQAYQVAVHPGGGLPETAARVSADAVHGAVPGTEGALHATLPVRSSAAVPAIPIACRLMRLAVPRVKRSLTQVLRPCPVICPFKILKTFLHGIYAEAAPEASC